MRITLNLSPAPSARQRYALAWAIPATLVGAVALVLLGRALRREFREYREVQSQVGEVQKHAEDLREEERSIRRKLDDPAYHELLRRSQFVNSLIDQRRLSLTDLSARLAGLLPDEAHLTGLSLTTPKGKNEEYVVRMGIVAKNEDAIETFLNDLEDAPDFKDVVIVNEGFLEESAQPGQVNIVCTARYLPGAE
jgi:hypothetical protein